MSRYNRRRPWERDYPKGIGRKGGGEGGLRSLILAGRWIISCNARNIDAARARARVSIRTYAGDRSCKHIAGTPEYIGAHSYAGFGEAAKVCRGGLFSD